MWFVLFWSCPLKLCSQFDDDWGLLFCEGLCLCCMCTPPDGRWCVEGIAQGVEWWLVQGINTVNKTESVERRRGTGSWAWQFYGWSNRKRDRMCCDDMAAAPWILHGGISELIVLQRGVPFIICTLPSCFIAAVISSSGVKEKKTRHLHSLGMFPCCWSFESFSLRCKRTHQSKCDPVLSWRSVAIQGRKYLRYEMSYRGVITVSAQNEHSERTAEGSLCGHGFMIVAMQLLILLPW